MAKVCEDANVFELGKLFLYVPCKCYRNPLNDEGFTVITNNCNTSSTPAHEEYFRGPKVKLVYIKCNRCGEETLRDLEFDDVYENEFLRYF